MTVAILDRLAPAAPEFVVECEGFCPPALAGDPVFRLRVAWADSTARKADRVRRTEQPRPIVERAAVGLAALAFAKLLPAAQMRVTRQGDRADYWLPRLRCALEISGTQHGRELRRRHQ